MPSRREHSPADFLLDATQSPDLWPAALRKTASTFNSDHAFAYLVGPSGVRSFVSEGSEDLLSKVLAERWQERNPRMLRGLQAARSGQHGLLTDWRLFSRDEIASDPFEQDFAHPNHCAHYAGTFVPISSDAFLVIDVERRASKGIYGGAELDRLSRTFKQSSNSIGYALRAQAQLTEGLVNSLSIGDIAHAWVDGYGRLNHWSSNFDALVGRFVGVSNGRIVALRGDADLLLWLISRAAAGEQINAVVELGNPLDVNDAAVARAVPLQTIASRLALRADVLISIEIRKSRTVTLSETLRARYRLTPAEVRLVLKLHDGLTLRAAAEIEQITYETARTRLRMIFGKLSVSRQSELIRLLGGL